MYSTGRFEVKQSNDWVYDDGSNDISESIESLNREDPINNVLPPPPPPPSLNIESGNIQESAFDTSDWSLNQSKLHIWNNDTCVRSDNWPENSANASSPIKETNTQENISKDFISLENSTKMLFNPPGYVYRQGYYGVGYYKDNIEIHGHDGVDFSSSYYLPTVLMPELNKPLINPTPSLDSSTDSDIPDLSGNINNMFEYTAPTLYLRKALDGTMYLSIPDVFKYVTLGGRLSNHELINLGNYIKTNYGEYITPYGKISIEKTNIMSGESITISINHYGWEHYRYIAQACLSWATKFPQKVFY
mgnify:FL=1